MYLTVAKRKYPINLSYISGLSLIFDFTKVKGKAVPVTGREGS
jgi:hypothetical protein